MGRQMDGWMGGWLDVKESAEEAQRGSVSSQRTVINEASVLEKMRVAVVISMIICCN